MKIKNQDTKAKNRDTEAKNRDMKAKNRDTKAKNRDVLTNISTSIIYKMGEEIKTITF